MSFLMSYTDEILNRNSDIPIVIPSVPDSELSFKAYFKEKEERKKKSNFGGGNIKFVSLKTLRKNSKKKR